MDQPPNNRTDEVAYSSKRPTNCEDHDSLGTLVAASVTHTALTSDCGHTVHPRLQSQSRHRSDRAPNHPVITMTDASQ